MAFRRDGGDPQTPGPAGRDGADPQTPGPSGHEGGHPQPAGTTLERVRDNPFYVLGLRPDATRAEIEREGQKLLGMLELSLQSAARYATPVGSTARTADKVRRAMAELRDPERRLEHEMWARLDPAAGPLPAPAEGRGPARLRADAPWPDALSQLGWRAAR